MFDSLKLASNIEQTCINISKTSTSSAVTNEGDYSTSSNNILEEEVVLEKDFICKKRKRREGKIKKKCN